MGTKKSMHALPNREKWISLTRAEIKHIFIYYIILFFASLAAMVLFIFHFALSNEEVGITYILLFSFICGILGGTFYYIRKLYKSCIQSLVSNTEDADENIKSLGVKVYFYFRPIMGAVLSIFLTLGIYGGFFVLLDSPVINSDKFYIYIAILAFLVGFSNGKLIVSIDNATDNFVKTISSSMEGK